MNVLRPQLLHHGLNFMGPMILAVRQHISK